MELDERRLRRQLDILTELRDLNLIHPRERVEYTVYTGHELESDMSEDRLSFNLQGGCGNWGGTYREFEALCRMVRQLGNPGNHSTAWTKLGLNQSEWEELVAFSEERISRVSNSIFQKIISHVAPRT